MSMAGSIPPGIDAHAIQWIKINNFTPGGYDASHISTSDPVNSAPLGACQLRQTWACAAIPGGALAPLPARTVVKPFSTIGGLQGASTFALLAGVAVTPELNNGGNEVVTIQESDDGTNHFVNVTSYNDNTATLTPITNATSSGATTPGFFGAPYPVFTRLQSGGGGTVPPPGPVLVFPTAYLTDTTAGAAGHLWVYPNPATRTSFAALDLITGASGSRSSVTGQVITYGNRVICIVGVPYSWPTGNGILVNENFNYTDPPESTAYGNQQTIAAVESPWGYGAWGTMSVGELLVVKKIGGAVIINGDINTPTSIIPIPGVQPTGLIVGKAASTPQGLIYCSEKRGAWLWNGGNTSSKISANIADDFFNLEFGFIQSNNYGFNVFHWQKWVCFSNNVILDGDLGGWWQLYPKRGITSGPLVGQDIWWYNQTEFGNQIIVSPLLEHANTDPWYSLFDNTVPSPHYQWQTLPLHVDKNSDHVVDVRQIVIRASDPTNTGTATVTAQCGSFSATSTETIGINPEPIRFNVGNGAQGLDDIIVTVIADNPTANGSAPMIHSIDIGYRIRAHIPVND